METWFEWDFSQWQRRVSKRQAYRNLNDNEIITLPESSIHDTKSYQTTKIFIEQQIKEFTTSYYFQLLYKVMNDKLFGSKINFIATNQMFKMDQMLVLILILHIEGV